jgi:hypothetical protein
MPSGRLLMGDFCYASGLPAPIKDMPDLLELEALTVTGGTVAQMLQADRGADFDFLVGCRGADAPRESH